MSIYQFLVAVRQGADNLTNADGEITSHLSGLFYRTIKLLEYGMKPCYVFDGKPPQLKSSELAKRRQQRDDAEAKAEKAAEEGDVENLEKYSRRVNKVTPEMTAQCKKLLRLMGVPVVEAPGEAEAQCAELAKSGKVWATASEDMDALTFGTPRLVRHLWAASSATSEKKGMKPLEITLDTALEDLDLSRTAFVDLCILCGCDYTDSIRGVGPTKALQLIRKHGDLDNTVSQLRKEAKLDVPENFPVEQVRGLFHHPDVSASTDLELKWTEPDQEGLIQFMVHENSFKDENIRNGIKRILASKGKANQGRLDTFFSIAAAGATKRKSQGKPTKAAKKSATKRAK
eukprot:Plantae.Rhodophyta-Rhodochaete_pulchella.ctg1372.p1 GENE.Plantae.Rhodophyta-Rhodochaete_pulchella.ctg1372~~Plantae.Rhodophyta-Rhodochaete_pulchella.ctg1372.p1  ORF type:complete len:379 (-),score=71.65 Plantae.Rhodophyta-Rhodochaete_pulchella.ctg1372:590-1621(-)